ncbi:Isochorismatase-like protein [Clohesyomyces aquaticus]|uniref:Isochorismatase-like protein n=1 Tax=Clohesyomyces aquaticus TaxID=1231657 RepID=A0A1Y2A265_9PLEO|nr:Isochorismatase-like protein [Clohesyomyces aquaticus]
MVQSGPQSFRTLLGIPDSTASPTDSALIIIDAQNEYKSGKLKVTNAEASAKVIADLLYKYREVDGKIVHVLHKMPGGATVFTPGTELAEQMQGSDASTQENEPTIWKMHPGSFAGTDLDEKLKAWGIKKIVLVGYMAHVCISTTAREAAQLGYEVVLVEDAIGDRDIPGLSGVTLNGDEVTRMALVELADVFGTVVHSRMVK